MPEQAQWTFRRQERFWKPERTPGVDDNTLLGLELFAVPFGTRAWSVRDFIEVWREHREKDGDSAVLASTAAVIRAQEGGLVRICDRYGQFRDFVMEEADFEAALEALEAAMRAHSGQAG
ncbi:hypothetical protein [Allostreptomyces psammosilenae]|uniref:Uncharacterized protein n=1 Tax=Allostreptomyces psammosilenae TaxID=1892865 RepID=A0A852ZM54_9ACTN|nr:hypothetical protein [Allostreptomyces psammosilenae]NYI03483.1 hypothetical protein [Allostreptomyces psammosilenae]